MNPYSQNNLLEDRIRAASPAGLTLILLEQSVVNAKACIRSLEVNDPRARAAAVTKLLDILSELIAGLRPEMSADAAKRKTLYLSLQQLLVEGHGKAAVQPFKIAEGALASMLDEWRNVCRLLEGTPEPTVNAEERRPVVSRNPYEEASLVPAEVTRRWKL
jgi:flagellin-specific chaperone FliS